MAGKLKMMCALAHPDDESLGVGGTLAKLAAEGVDTYLLTATRGERGWSGNQNDYPGPEALGKIREGELRKAAEVLGIRQVEFLNYMDGDLDKADPVEATAKIVEYLRRVRPQVVVTFGPEGGYGHPDHIAISQLTTAAVVCAADSSYASARGTEAHRVSKLYYFVLSKERKAAYQSAFGDLIMSIDGVERHAESWEDWAITTRIDSQQYWRTVWEAVACHRTQLPNYGVLKNLSEDQHSRLWGCDSFYRVYSTVNGGHRRETDLFESLCS